MKKKTTTTDNVSLIFKRDFSILDKYREIIENENISIEELRSEYVALGERFEKLLQETVRLTRISDVNHRKLLNAKEKIEKQNRTAEATNRELLQEITERKQAEKARQAAEKELEAQRVLSMRSDRLRSLGEMAAGIAHEFSQPLVGVRGLTEHTLIAIDRGWTLTEAIIKERLNRIIEETDRMMHIVNHVRMFAREAGKPEVSPVQVNDVVHSARDMLGIRMRSHGVDVSCDLADNLPLVSANPHSLEDAILNLLTNARDAVEERQQADSTPPSARVLVRTGLSGEGPKSEVRIEVEDNGVGIPEEILEKVFDPFFTTKAPDKGMGLGLSISKSIVEKFGGNIQIRSTPGEGTIVTLSLPAAEGCAWEASVPDASG